MSKSGWLAWLHRIGYVTTIIVAVEAVGLGFLAWNLWENVYRAEARTAQESRTRDGSFSIRDGDLLRRDAARSLAPLPPLSSMAGNGFRFAAMPSFSDRWFSAALYLPRDSNEAEGVLATLLGDDEKARTLSVVKFSVPRARYLGFIQRIDALADGWAGDRDLCMDGTTVAFERVNGARITSGIGNAICSKHYGEISASVLSLLRQYGPRDILPSESDWVPADAAAPSSAATSAAK